MRKLFELDFLDKVSAINERISQTKTREGLICILRNFKRLFNDKEIKSYTNKPFIKNIQRNLVIKSKQL